ncbi:MAG: pirin family protein [Myxococcota bacterium]|nr:pirin family protein [Myxococcota bacterium]
MSIPFDAVVQRVDALPPAGPWPVLDPFLFCVHHDDRYPAGNGKMAPAADLSGRRLGQDFSGQDGWSMYHGHPVPGFPRHPHRGFETVTVVRRGLIDHADSMGAAARYGHGDAQWLTAGDGINHAEMFPLLDDTKPNPLDLFQIWLNLPQKSKRVKPYFSMFWADKIPKVTRVDAQGNRGVASLIAGELDGVHALSPPPNSWASNSGSELAIMTIKLDAHAYWPVPPAKKGVKRAYYIVDGRGIVIAGRTLKPRTRFVLQEGQPALLQAGQAPTELLLLQGRSIGEPVARHGPFVMNTREEIMQAYADYRRTQFGGWPWPDEAPVHGHRPDRFARYADGRIDKPS